MAHHKSAVKRHNQSRVRRARNRIVKSVFKTQLKKAHADIAEGTANPNEGSVHDAVSLLAKAGRKNILHPKTAARRVSRLMRAAAKAKK